MAVLDKVDEFIEVGGAKIHYLRGGQGRPLVYLHSVEGNLGWLSAQRALAEHCTVFAPTHPGFGLSERPAWLETMSDLARFYLWLLDELGLDQVTLAGHFLGGWLAAEMAVMCPHRIDRLILIDAAGIKPQHGEILDIFLHGLGETHRLSFYDAAQAPEYNEIFGGERSAEEREMATQNWEMAVRLGWKPYMYSPSLPALLPRLRLPTLLIWGREDHLVPLEVGELYQQAIPNARLATLDQCGHRPQVEKPAEFTRLVLDFLKA